MGFSPSVRARAAEEQPQVRIDSSLYAHYVLGLLLVTYAFNFLDRQILSVSLESIKGELALTDTQLGLLTGVAFAIFYSILGIPIANWADRGNRPTIISLSLAVISATVALCSVVTSFAQMMIVRIGIGVGEAGVVPPAHSLVSAYFDRSGRLRAMSILLLGGPLSMAIGYMAGGWFNELYGWRVSFEAVAIPGILLTLLVKLTVREPRQPGLAVAQDRPAERASIRDVLALLWQQRTFRYLLFAFGIDNLCGNGLLQWLPVFFVRSHKMGTGELGTWLAISWGLGNAIGTFAGGHLTNRSTANPERRQLLIMAAVAIAYVPINAAILLIPNKELALGMLFVAALVNALVSAPSFSLIQSLAPENMRATAVAVIFLLGNLIGLGVGPLAVGMLSDGLSHAYGSDSLRIALLICVPGYWWVAAQYYKAARTVTADILAIENE